MNAKVKGLIAFLFLVCVGLLVGYIYTLRVDLRLTSADEVQDKSIAKVGDRLETVETRITKVVKQEKNVLGRVDKLEDKVKTQAKAIANVKDSVATMEGKIATCRAKKGDKGDKGDQGDPGKSIKGDKGEPGLDGLNCWDLDGDRVKDPEEDINGDGLFNTADCCCPKPEEVVIDPVPESEPEKVVVEKPKKVEKKSDKKVRKTKKARRTRKVRKARKVRTTNKPTNLKPCVTIVNDNSVVINGAESSGSETPDDLKIGNVENQGTLILNVNSVKY